MSRPPPEHASRIPRAVATDVPPIIGVLGGIASGKSLVGRLLAGEDGVLIEADALVTELYASPAFRDRLRAHFGPQVPSLIGPDGAVDRAALARLVFSDPEQRKLLESWIHPAVRERILSRIEESRAAGARRVILDVPLLLENDAEHQLAGLCRTLVFVDAPAELRDARAVAARGWARGEVARREALQMPLEQKRARAQHVLSNQSDLTALGSAVQALLRKLERDPRTRAAEGA